MRQPRSIILALTLAASPLPMLVPVAANPLKSLYTTIELKSCRVTKKHADGNAWRCPGLDRYAVHLAEGDLRTFASYGPNPERRRAAEQTLGPFNSIFDPSGAGRATLEWRIVRMSGKPVPFATILRYFTRSDRGRGQVLVVTKVSPTEACHVAYVDAVANPNAIAIARQIADEKARAFNCKSEATFVGVRGQAL